MSDITANAVSPAVSEKKDILKDTPLRALGYMDDIGAASRPLVSASKSGLLRAFPGVAYIPATVYMAANVVDKFHKGADGTGKSKVKAGFREALYQGAVNVLAPVGIVAAVSKGTSKLAANAPKLAEKLPENVKNIAGNLIKKAKETKIGEKIMKNKTMMGKAAIFALSIAALSVLSKPVDKITDKIFNKTIDPLLKLNKTKEVEE